jgi:hypothetical protein
MFSWTNPDAEFRILCRFNLKNVELIGQKNSKEIIVEIEPDNLDLK